MSSLFFAVISDSTKGFTFILPNINILTVASEIPAFTDFTLGMRYLLTIKVSGWGEEQLGIMAYHEVTDYFFILSLLPSIHPLWWPLCFYR